MKTPLDKLHDFYRPPPPSWRPQTIGWYVVFVVCALLLLWLAVHLVRQWNANRYRREALKELTHSKAVELSSLLKRTALCAWPRQEVAALSGEAWLTFLDTSAGRPLFAEPPANRIEDFALQPAAISSEDEDTLRRASARWIKTHKVPRPGRRHVSA